MNGHFHAGITIRNLPGDLSAIILRRVIDDEHPYVDTVLVLEHTGDGVGKKMAVVVARDDDAD
jgi:hypothetical protein